MRVHETTINADSPAGKALLEALLKVSGGNESGSIDIETLLGSPGKRGAKFSEIFGGKKAGEPVDFAAFMESILSVAGKRNHHKVDPADQIKALREFVSDYTKPNPFVQGDLVQDEDGRSKTIFIVLETFPGNFPATEAEYEEIAVTLPPTCLIAHSQGGRSICTHYVHHSDLKAYVSDAAKGDTAPSSEPTA